MPTVTIEIPAEHEATIRRVLALQDELTQLALTAPEGTVLDACEQAVLDRGRDLQRQLLADAVDRRIATAEKKGRRSAPVRVVGGKKIAARRNANSSPPSG